MNSDREELLFGLALTKLAAERALFLDRECGKDKDLRARLEALLAAHEQPETLLALQAEAARPTIKRDLALKALRTPTGSTSCRKVPASCSWPVRRKNRRPPATVWR